MHGSSRRQNPFSCNWSECRKRNDQLRRMNSLKHLRPFQIHSLIYDVVKTNQCLAEKYIKNICNTLTEDNYFDNMRAITAIHEAMQSILMRRNDLIQPVLSIKTIETNDEGLNYFDIQIERLLDVQPPLVTGDIVIFRDIETNLCRVGKITSIEGNIIRLPFRHKNPTREIIERSWVVSFVRHNSIYSYYDKAIALIEKNAVARMRLFERGDDQSTTMTTIYDHKIDINLKLVKAQERLANLNQEQCQAVKAILAAECRPKPYILIGEESTGKTHTLAEAIAQIYASENFAKILYCANYGDRVDEMWNKLKKIDFISSKFVHRYSACGNNEDLEPVQIILATTKDCSGLMEEPRFDYVIIDAVCLSIEFENVVPISLLHNEGCLVLAGVPMNDEGLGTYVESILERVLKFNAYKKNLETNQYDVRYLTQLSTLYESQINECVQPVV